MKVAVIKLGARLADAGTSGGSGEALAIIKMLVDGGCRVHAFSKYLKKDSPIPGVIKEEISEKVPTGFDALVVINGNVNFFGGVEDRSQILNYKYINKFDGPVFYVMCDPNLTLKQIWPSIEKKTWKNCWNKEDIFITRKDIVYLSQPYDLEAVKELISRTKIEIKDVIHFPFHKFPLMHEPNFRDFSMGTVDLIYGGTFRNGKRQGKMIEYYFGHKGLIVEMFGKIEQKHFTKDYPEPVPRFRKAVQYNEFIEKMKTGLATCIIGDKWYEGRDINQRIYEGILAGVITFVDAEFDPRGLIFDDAKLASFLYVHNREELRTKIQKLKDTLNPKLLRQLQEAQYEAVKIDWTNYCKKFVSRLGATIGI